MSKKILLIGAGGHCRSVLDCLLDTDTYDEIGLIDIPGNIGKKVLGVSVIGCDQDIPYLYTQGFKEAFVTLGTIDNFSLKMASFEQLEKIGFEIPAIISGDAVVSKHVSIAAGVFVGKKAVINAGVHIDRGAIINTAAVVEHDCRIGEFSHIASGAVLSGSVNVGRCSHVGANSVIRQGLAVGDHTIIGIGSAVVKNIKDYKLAYGNPCVVVRDI